MAVFWGHHQDLDSEIESQRLLILSHGRWDFMTLERTHVHSQNKYLIISGEKRREMVRANLIG